MSAIGTVLIPPWLNADLWNLSTQRIKFAGAEAMVLNGMLVISKVDKPPTEKGLALR